MRRLGCFILILLACLIWADKDARAAIQTALTSPADSHNTVSAVPTFTWAAVGTDSPATRYLFQLATDATFGIVRRSAEVDTYTFSHTLSYSDTDSLTGTYYWRVLGDNTPSTESRRITFSLPTLTCPANGANTTSQRITLIWSEITGVDTYSIEIDGASTPSQTIISDTYYVYAPALNNDVYTWRIQAYKNGTPYTNWSSAWTFTIQSITLITPTNGSQTTSQTPLFDWDNVSGLDASDSYQLQIATNNTFGATTVDTTFSAAVSSFTPSTNLSEGTYFWRVKGLDDNDTLNTNWSDIRYVIIDTVAGAPDTPTLTAPANGICTNSGRPLFQWSNVADEGFYTIQISTDQSFPASPATISDTTAADVTSCTPSSALNEATYYWRVRAHDNSNDDLVSNWSTVWKVTVDSTAPSVPGLSSPDSGSWVAQAQPTFSWTNVSGLDYSLQISTSDTGDFGAGYLVALTGNTGLTGSSYTSTTPLTENDTYYWRLIATDCADNTNTSTLWWFGIDTTAPTMPADLSDTPNDGDCIPNSTYSFVWNAASDSTTITYHFEIDTEGTFSAPLTASAYNLTVRTKTLTLGDGTYYWRVRAKDAAGNVSSWMMQTVTIDAAFPTAPIAVYPTMASLINDTTPLFDWQDVTELNFTKYTIQVGTGSTLTGGIIINDTTSLTSRTTSAYQYTGTNLLDGTIYSWRIEVIDCAGNTTVGSIWTFTIDTTDPPDAEIPASLGNPTLTNDSTPSLDWNDADTIGEAGALSYRLEIDDATDFLTPVLTGTVDVSNYTLTVALSDGLYYWRVISIDAAGNESAGSIFQMLSIDTLPPDEPPALIWPPQHEETVTNDNTPTLQWRAVTGATEYGLQVDNNPDYSSPVINITRPGGTTSYTVTEPLADGTYYWRMRAKDGAGNWTGWIQVNASPGSFTIDTIAPDAPALISPNNYSRIKDQTPFFDWSDVTDNDNVCDTIYYIIQVDSGPTFGSSIMFSNDPADTPYYYPNFFAGSGCIFTFLGEGTYYWRIAARDEADNTSAWSEAWQFVLDISPPSAPSLVSPDDNSYLSNNKPAFDWSDVTGATYTIQVDDNRDFSSPELNVSGLSLSSYTPQTPLSDGRYYWRVKAHEPATNQTAWSTETFELVIDTVPADGEVFPILLTPEDKANINTQRPTLEWKAVADPSQVTYHIQVAKTSGFYNLEINNSENTRTYHTATTNLDEGTHYWRVVATDAATNKSHASVTFSFTVDVTAPGTPSLASPDDGSSISDVTPAFDWQDALGASSYVIEIDQDDDFYSPLLQVTVDVSGYTSGLELENGRTYYWRVKAIDAAGNESGFSDVRSVRISSTYINRVNGVVKEYAVTGQETWKAENSPFIVEDNLVINENAHLTIEPGVVIKFTSGADLKLTVKGRLTAAGTQTNRIVFTSYNINACFPNPCPPAPCDWRGIIFTDESSDSSILSYCDIFYAGSKNDVKKDNIEIRSASPAISYCRISKGCGYGIYARGNSHPNISGCEITDNNLSGILFEVPSGPLAVTNCTISYNEGWGIENPGHPLTGNTTALSVSGCIISANASGGIYTTASSSETIVNNQIKDNLGWAVRKGSHSNASIGGYVIKDNDISGNNNNGIYLTEPKHNLNTTWYKNWNNFKDIPAPIYFDWVTVDTGVTLTIDSGVVVKINTKLIIKGTLKANGTGTSRKEGIVFTSYRDDDAGGDTNHDGDTDGQKGDWDFVQMNNASNSSILTYCTLRYSDYGLELTGTSPTIRDSIFEENTYRAIGCKNRSSPTITGNNFRNNGGFDPHSLDGGVITTLGYDAAKPTITNNQFINNSNNYPILITADNAGRISGNTMQGNTYNAIRIQEIAADAGVDTDVTWVETAAPFLLAEGTRVGTRIDTLSLAPKLKIQSDVIIKTIGAIKIDTGYFTADGAVFTSYLDDSAGGDTNGDGDATTPAANNWSGILFSKYSLTSSLQDCTIRYANAGIGLTSASPAITRCIISKSRNGVECYQGSSPTISDCAISNNYQGIVATSSSLPSVNNCEIANNSSYGIINTDISVTIPAENNWWGDSSGPEDDDPLGLYNPAGKGNQVSNYVDYLPWVSAGLTPVADAGSDQTVYLGSMVILDGGGSYNPGGGSLTYNWTQNPDNPASFTLPQTKETGFTPAIVGDYEFELAVNNGAKSSAGDEITVHVLAPDTTASLHLNPASYQVAPGDVFTLTVEVGNAAYPVSNLFGISFNLNFTPAAYLDITSVTAGDFLSVNPDKLVFDYDIDRDKGQVEVGVSRKASYFTGGANGYGVVANISFRLSNNAAYQKTVDLSFSNITTTHSDGSKFGLSVQGGRITVGTVTGVTSLYVWPGDTNNDGYVDARDVLPIGIYWHYKGDPRPEAGTLWVAQEAYSWSTSTATYADANGDGEVNASDVLVIGLNWHKSHNSGSAAPSQMANKKPGFRGAAAASPVVNDSIDYSQYVEAYRAIYQAIEDAPAGPANSEIKELLASIIKIGIARRVPDTPVLGQNYPNPMNPETWLPYALPEATSVDIRIYNLSGQLVRTISLGELEAGSYLSKDRAAYWNGQDESGREVASGIYFYQLQAGDSILTRRMIVLK
ncbi:MAG: Ig-like domain-containing protein [bacterium]|nr:Ig-like domain-containing protein [bacterium]